MDDPDFKYWAFISYSTRDRAAAQGMFRRLEAYRLPRRLVGKPGRDGAVPRRIYPIFRDREELPTSADLGGAIAAALAASRFLIVLCSPHSARSLWVNEEVRAFKQLGRANRILCLILDGEPNATDKGDPGAECFCPALRYAVGPGGALGAERVEPLGADLRPGMDAPATALLKLVAGIVGVDFDALAQRERRRRLWRRAGLAGIAAGITALVTGGAWLDREAHRARSHAAANAAFDLIERERHGAAIRRLAAVLPADAESWFRPLAPVVASALALALERNRLALVLGGMRKETDSLHFSPDGARLLTASRDNAVRLWDARSGHLLRALAHPATADRTWRAVFLDGGATIVSAGPDRRVRLFDAASGAERPRPDAILDHGAAIRVLVADDAGASFATGAADGEIAAWSAAERAPRWRIAAHDGAVHQLAMARGGSWLASAGADGVVRLWDTQTGRALAELRDPVARGRGPVLHVALSSAGDRAVTVGESREALLWDLGDLGAPRIAARLVHDGLVHHAAFDAAGRRVATASADRTARLWDAATGAALGAPMRHRHAVRHVAFRPDGAWLATSSQDNSARLWDAATGAPIDGLDLRGHAHFVWLAAFDPAGRRLATASSDMTVRIWDLAAPPGAVALRGHDGAVRRTRFDPSGQRLVSVGADGRALIWHVARGEVAKAAPRFPVAVYGAAFDRGGERVVLALHDRTARIWTLGDDTFRVLDGHGGPVVDADFDRDGTRIATVTFAGDNRARLFDASSGRFLGVEFQEPALRRPLWSVRFHPDGRRLLIGAHNERGLLWDTAGLGRVVELGGHSQSVNAAVLSADGSLALTLSSDRTARLWRSDDGTLLRVLGPHEDFVLGGAFTPDASRILTATRGGMLRVFAAATGRLLAERAVPGRPPIYSVDVSPDGRLVALALDDGTVRLVSSDFDPQALLDRARALLAATAAAPD